MIADIYNLVTISTELSGEIVKLYKHALMFCYRRSGITTLYVTSMLVLRTRPLVSPGHGFHHPYKIVLFLKIFEISHISKPIPGMFVLI